MRRNADAQQPVESVQFTGVKKLLKVEDVADILGVAKSKCTSCSETACPRSKSMARAASNRAKCKPGSSSIAPDTTRENEPMPVP